MKNPLEGGGSLTLKFVQVGVGFVGCAILRAVKDRVTSDIAGVDITAEALDRARSWGLRMFHQKCFDEYNHAPIFSFSINTPSLPSESDEPTTYDLRYLESALRQFGRDVLKDASDWKLIVIRSTVSCGTTESRLIPLLEDVSGKTAGKDFGVVYNPEFLRQEDALACALKPPAIVYAASDDRSAQVFEEFFSGFRCPQVVRYPMFILAEAHKAANNCVNAVCISMFNEWYLNLKRVGVPEAEIERMLKTVCLTAFAKQELFYGAILKGPYGGACLPKDSEAVIVDSPRVFGRQSVMVMTARKVNQEVQDLCGVVRSGRVGSNGHDRHRQQDRKPKSVRPMRRERAV